MRQSDVDDSTETPHGDGDETQQDDMVKEHEEVDGIFGMLQVAEFSRLKELRIQDRLLLAPPNTLTLARLTTLEVA